ncbi:MAG TPA: sigma-54-dependent Fis family transcriptional regulator [Bacillales bacterium]|nr:sigma-54-dependent Fis family transcriptional regulator [Bacillales bacterium]
MKTALSFDTWQRLVNEGALDSSRLNQKLVESWYRSKKADVNPYLERGQRILPDDQFQTHKKENSLLLDSALPHADQMSRFAEESGMIALLIDPKGYVLWMKGNQKVINEADKINFIEGVRWTESEVGTNAIGTALHAEEPIMVTGTEHFSIASHPWSCSAAPVRNDDGELIGVIDISCPINRAHPYMLGMVTSMAYSIERDVSIQMHKDEIDLIHSSMALIEEKRPLVICNLKLNTVSASKPIRNTIQNWEGMKISEIKQHGFDVQMEAPIYSKHHGRLIGKCIYLLENTAKKEKNVYIASTFHFKGVGLSPTFQRTIGEVKKVSPTNATTCIIGETGTGKEVIARSIHENGSRRKGPFVAVNCGAVQKDLIASELFGYADGAFTGARRKGHKGKFEQANQGTIFLDEVEEVPHAMQVALLRVLQERQITPVGGTRVIPVDVRIITATHRDLRQLVNEGRFREDLYYRLHVYPIRIPPLRERKEDIPHLVRYFCRNHNWNIKFPLEFFDRLKVYKWPGNIRELFNVLERLRILLQDTTPDQFQILDMLDSFKLNDTQTQKTYEEQEIAFSNHDSLTFRDKVQRDLMIETLRKTKGNVSMAAKLLDVPRSTFYKRIKKFNL